MGQSLLFHFNRYLTAATDRPVRIPILTSPHNLRFYHSESAIQTQSKRPLSAMLIGFSVIASFRCLVAQGDQINHKAVLHIAPLHAGVGVVDGRHVNDFDLGHNAVPTAEIQHLLCFLESADQ
jgi:hypothetical protein